ncbi:MAG: aromatic ring-hydroxylating oxygenase subunit alpha [Alphaproteobacteria bacterium]
MGQTETHPLTMDGHDPRNLRGDPITGDRYYSPEFAQREWDHMWTRIWHVAGVRAEMKEPGDYIVHDFMHESVFIVLQNDGSLKGFYNTCQHRGQRLVWETAHAGSFACPYHGWVWGRDGVLEALPDQEDFPQGDPCGTLSLKEVQVDCWGGFVWYSMDADAEPLLDYLEPMPEIYKNYPMESAVRVGWYKIELNTNWKFATDNFVESYHTRTAHPQVPPWIDQDYWTSRLEMFPRGHGRTVQPLRPSLRDRVPEGEAEPFDETLRAWDIDPDQYPDFKTKVSQGWLDLKAQRRKLGPGRGHAHYAQLNDEEITDSPHTVIFPNVTLSFLPDEVIFFRTEPHPDDPNKCTFDLWSMVFPIDGATEVEAGMIGTVPFEEAELQHRVFDGGKGVPELHGSIVLQDMMLAEGQQRGLRSRGYEDSYLAAQETRVRFFHEVLNDWLNGRR